MRQISKDKSHISKFSHSGKYSDASITCCFEPFRTSSGLPQEKKKVFMRFLLGHYNKKRTFDKN